VRTFVQADFMNGDDVRVIQGRRGARFLLESAQAIFVAREFPGQNLEGDPPPQARIFGEVDFAHPASADLFDNPVMGYGVLNHLRLSMPSA